MNHLHLDDRLAARKRPAGPAVLHMQWTDLLFLHWAWDPEEIQRTLPAGLQVDVFDSRAWLGVVPFFMRRVHPPGLPCLPGLSDFLELNVRTYVFDTNGVPGVWFYSLACNQPVAVELARRLFHLNYVHARMRAERRLVGVHYTAERAGKAVYNYRPLGSTQLATPGSLEFFLLERYVLFSTDRKKRIFSGRVHHQPYNYRQAEVRPWSFLPAEEDGFAHPGRAPDHICTSRTVAVEAWPIRRA